METEQNILLISQSTSIVAPTHRECQGKSELSPTLDRSKMLPKTMRRTQIFSFTSMTGCCLDREVKFSNWFGLLRKRVLMIIIGRMEKTGDKIYFLGRVIERTARGYSVEANPKYIRNVIDVLGLEEAKPMMTPSVKRTPTTESLV